MRFAVRKITEQDIAEWNNYITKLWSKPETFFKPNKARQDEQQILDLHGMTIQTAFNKTRQFVQRHYDIGSKLITVITGKSGKIADEFPYWLNNLPCIHSYEQLEDSRGQSGAYIIRLKKSS
jgi:DNA-nicking Smr family endonuclease